jgi:hypothetical protein
MKNGKKHIWKILISAVSAAAAVVCLMQFVMAIAFMELGRVVFYFTLALICLEISVISIWNFFKKRK